MTKFKVCAFSVSIDGFGAGPNQSLENPLGVGGLAMHEWFFPTHTFQAMHGGDADGTDGIDNQFAKRSFDNIGSWILGRNMFGPVRGDWPDDSWKGWWGDEPPYHCDVFVLTHHARGPLSMQGGTTFHFVTGGIEEAAERAAKAAAGKDVRIGGGVSVVRQYLKAGMIDSMHLTMSPALLGAGEELFHGIDLTKLGFVCTERVAGEGATHIVLSKS